MHLALVSFYLRALIFANIGQQNITIYPTNSITLQPISYLRGSIDHDLMKTRAGDSV